jgi:hypothetical protein
VGLKARKEGHRGTMEDASQKTVKEKQVKEFLVERNHGLVTRHDLKKLVSKNVPRNEYFV